eukprot:51017-Pyramimonas_sp.AAC.1
MGKCRRAVCSDARSSVLGRAPRLPWQTPPRTRWVCRGFAAVRASSFTRARDAGLAVGLPWCRHRPFGRVGNKRRGDKCR